MDDQQIRRDVLDACHGLAAAGLGNVVGGHVSIRVPGRPLYWTNVLDLSFEEMGDDDLLLVDFDGRIVSGNRPISPGIDFHQGIYMQRPEVNAIVHTHGAWIVAQAALSRPIKMWHNLSTYFHDKVAVSPDDTLEAISPVLGENIAIVMPWHGAITVGRSIAEAAALHTTYEFAARLDVLLDRSDALEMPDDACDRMQVLLGKADYLERTWELMKRRARRELPMARAISTDMPALAFAQG